MKIAIDIGATSIKYGLIENQQVIHKDHIKTRNQNGTLILEDIEKILVLFQDKAIDFIGIATAGVVCDSKIIGANNNIKEYRGVDLAIPLQKVFPHVEFQVLNDVTAFANYQTHYKQIDNSIVLTLGTGVGASYLLNGKVYSGVNGAAGEVGAIPWNNSTVDKQFSAVELFQRINQITTIKSLSEVYLKENQLLKTLIQQFEDEFSKFLLMLILILNPEEIIIGGGMVHIGQKFIDHINNNVKKIMPLNLKFVKIKIRFSVVGNEGILLGSVIRIQ